MSRQFKGLKEIKGPLIILDDVQNVAFEEVVEIELDDGSTRFGRAFSIASIALCGTSFVTSLNTVPSISKNKIALSILLNPNSYLFLNISTMSTIS